MKKVMTILTAFLLVIMMALPVAAQDTGHPSRLVDEADILTDAEENEVLELLDDFSEELDFDIVVVAVDSLDGKSAEAYADDYFDYNGYGMGDNYDGAILLISMEERDWHISTCGYGIAALSDRDLERMGDIIVPYLSSGDYAGAFEEFAWLCAGYVEEAIEAGVTGEMAEESGIRWGRVIITSLLVGFLLAFIPMLMMKQKMKTVVSRSEAGEYMNRGSRRITRSRDAFLYHTINKTYTPRDHDGGGSSHRSSSGRSHGGRGGKF